MREGIGNKIIEYEELGIQLWLEDEKLKFRSKKDVFLPEILKEIKENKEDIILFLKESEFELTPIQYAYFIGSTADCELGNMNAQYYVEYEHPSIETNKMKAAIHEVIRNNPALMTIIDPKGYQKELSDIPPIEITVREIQSERELADVREYWRKYQYKYGEWPMFHFQISKRQGEKDRLHMSFDCIILDAWSAKLMMEEIFHVYLKNKVSYPEIRFKEYIERSKAFLEKNKTIALADAYWEKAILNMPSRPIFKVEKCISKIRKPNFERVDYSFSKAETIQLYETIRKYRFTPSAVMCTAYARILSKHCIHKNFTLNLTLFNRNPVHEDIEKILGDFTNIGFVTFEGERNRSMLEEIKDVQKQLWKLVQFRTYDGTKILKKLSKGLPGKAIMPVVFTGVLQGVLDHKETAFKECYAISQTPQVMLDHQARDDEGMLYLSWDYVKEVFEQYEIESIFLEYIDLIKSLLLEESWDKLG